MSIWAVEYKKQEIVRIAKLSGIDIIEYVVNNNFFREPIDYGLSIRAIDSMEVFYVEADCHYSAVKKVNQIIQWRKEYCQSMNNGEQ